MAPGWTEAKERLSVHSIQVVTIALTFQAAEDKPNRRRQSLGKTKIQKPQQRWQIINHSRLIYDFLFAAMSTPPPRDWEAIEGRLSAVKKQRSIERGVTFDTVSRRHRSGGSGTMASCLIVFTGCASRWLLSWCGIGSVDAGQYNSIQTFQTLHRHY